MQKNTRAGIAVAVALAGVLGITGAALADGYPSQQQVKHAQANVAHEKGSLAQVRAELASAQSAADAADQRAEIASERYNGAMWKLSLAKSAAAKAENTATAARKRVTDQRAGIATMVVQSYQDGTSLNGITAMLGKGGPEEVMAKTGVISAAGDSLKADYDRYLGLSNKADRAEAAATTAAQKAAAIADTARNDKAAAAAAAVHAESLATDVSQRRNEVVTALAKAEHTSIALARQRQDALERIARAKAAAAERKRAEEAAKKAQAEAAAEQAKAAKNRGSDGPSSGGSGTTTPVAPPPSGSGVAAAISYAKAQLGKPYLWAAAGPDRFDCSGLTMMAWRQGGIDLPHFSGAQYDAGTPEAITDARPGDLLFWSYNGRPSGIHHVALYLGNGNFIEAPHTGADVRYNTIGAEYPNFAVRL